jgi:hypothetical protein
LLRASHRGSGGQWALGRGEPTPAKSAESKRSVVSCEWRREARSNDRFWRRGVIAVIDHGATRMRGGAAVALLERRQTRLSRQLSTFLEEMLRLVAEQARELIGADCCVAHGGGGRRAPGPPKRLPTGRTSGDGRRFIRWLDLLAIYRVVRQSGGSARIAGEQFARLPPFAVGRAGAELPESVYLASP